MQDDRVAALDVLFQRALAVRAVDQHAKVAIFQRILAVDQGQVTVRNARLHAVAFDNQIKIVLRVLDTGIFFTVVLFKGKGTVTGAHRAHNGDKALGIAAESVAAHSRGRGRCLLQAQQGVSSCIQDLGQAGHRLRVRGRAAGLPLANSLLGNAKHTRNFSLAVSFSFSGFSQAVCKHNVLLWPGGISSILWSGHFYLSLLYNRKACL